LTMTSRISTASALNCCSVLSKAATMLAPTYHGSEL
jgi:hypothetical protein